MSTTGRVNATKYFSGASKPGKSGRQFEEYLEALEGVPEAEEWLNWCKERLTKTCALGETDLPMAVPFDEHENRELIAAFEQRLPEDESQW